MYIKQVSAGSRLRHLHLGSLELPDSKRRRRSARQPDSAKRRSRQAVCPDVYGRHTRCASATEQPVSKYSTLDRCSYAVQSQDPSPEHSRSGMKILPTGGAYVLYHIVHACLLQGVWWWQLVMPHAGRRTALLRTACRLGLQEK